MNVYVGDPRLMDLAEGDLMVEGGPHHMMYLDYLENRGKMIREFGYDNRLESYDHQRLSQFIATELSDAPTLVSWLFGVRKLIRALPYPFHKYSITHDGVVFIPGAMRAKSLLDTRGAVVPTYLVPPTTYREGDSHIEIVRIANPMIGVQQPYSVHKLLACTYLPTMTHMGQSVIHINGDCLDNHIQNLKVL